MNTARVLLYGILAVCVCACNGENDSTLSQANGVFDADIIGIDAGRTVDGSASSGQLYFVAPSTERSGDGQRYTPFKSVDEAYARAQSGDTVHLLPGIHTTFSLPPSGIRVQGSGIGTTIIPGPLSITRSDILLSDLTIRGGSPGLSVEAAIALEAIGIDRSDGIGLLVSARLDADGITVTNTKAADAERIFDGAIPDGGAAVLVTKTGSLHWVDGGVSDVQWTAIRIAGDATLKRLTISRAGGAGLAIVDGTVNAQQLRMSKVTSAGILLADGSLDASQILIRQTQSTEAVPLRAGIVAYGGQFVLDGVDIFSANRGFRLARGAEGTLFNARLGMMDIDGVSLDNSALTIERVSIDGAPNTGVSAVGDSTLQGRDLRIGATGRAGLFVGDSHVDLAELEINGGDTRGVTLLRADGRLDAIDISEAQNVGIQVTDPRGPVRLTNGILRDVGTSGIAIDGDSNPVTIEGFQIEGTKIGEADLGEGIHAYQAQVRLMDVRSDNNDGAGILAERAVVEGATIRLFENRGPGIVSIESSTRGALIGLTAHGNAGYGVLQLGGSLTIGDVEIEETRVDVAAGAGDGILSSLNAELILTDAPIQIMKNQNHGLSVDSGATVTISGDIVTQNNGGFGMHVVCNRGRVQLNGRCLCDNNQRGPENMCP